MAPPNRQRAPKTTIVVGLDFGTTYSGVAWARSTRPNVINVVSAWGGAACYTASDKSKAPSVISYDDEGRLEAWGYGFVPPCEPVKWFKLLLIDKADLPERLRFSHEVLSAKTILQKYNKDPVEVIGDYLRCLWQHAYSEISVTLGRQVLESCDLKIIATLPAIWPPYAQVRMREAIGIAGILDKRPAGVPTLLFISEPEAAALASLNDTVDKSDVEAHDHFVVCDAGGGTVDLITYEISSKEPMVVKESVAGDGALCGAILLDKAFMHMFRLMVPREIWDRLESSTIHYMTTVEWENGIKRNFSGQKDPWSLILPFSGIGGKSPKTKISRQVRLNKLQDIFDPVAEDITSLIQKQVDAVFAKHNSKPKAVILVGGLGKSPYIYQHLKKRFAGTEIIRDSGDRPWTAVCRGAVIRGLSDAGFSDTFSIGVGSRIARAHYGTLLNFDAFEEGKDDPRDKTWCPVHQRFQAVDQCEWFLKLGTQIEDSTVTRSYWQDFPEPASEVVIDLVYSINPTPSRRFDETVKSLCRIEWSKIPIFSSLPKWQNENGALFRKLAYDITMTVVGSSLDFAIYYKGRRMGSQNVAIKFEDGVAPKREANHSCNEARTNEAVQPNIDMGHQHQPDIGPQPASGSDSDYEQ